MTQQFSIAALRQQLARIETLEDDQLNGLLEQLEKQKAKLPLEDHPIIDWGISLIKIKLREKEQLMEEVIERLQREFTDDYETFISKAGWRNYNLKIPEGKKDLSKSLLEHLDKLFDESCGIEVTGILDKFVPIVKKHLQDFCVEKEEQKLANQLLGEYSAYYSERAKESEEEFTKSQGERNKKHSEHEQRLSEILRER